MKNRSIGKGVRAVIVVLLSLIWLVPTYLALVNAMTPARDYTGSPRWTPGGFAIFSNIATAWQSAEFGSTIVNSLAYSLVCAGVAVIVATIAAFGVTVVPTRWPVLWFWVIYAGSLLPLQVFARPMFLAAANTPLYDNWFGLALVYVAICVPFAFFVVRNYLTTVPVALTEAARLDGAGWWRVLIRIHLPLAKSALAAAFVFQFIWVWNELFFGQVLTITPHAQPVMVALAGLQGNYASVGPPVILAAAVAVSVPTVVLFLAFQRLFVSSLRANI